jgi:hypothetical protein
MVAANAPGRTSLRVVNPIPPRLRGKVARSRFGAMMSSSVHCPVIPKN